MIIKDNTTRYAAVVEGSVDQRQPYFILGNVLVNLTTLAGEFRSETGLRYIQCHQVK